MFNNNKMRKNKKASAEKRNCAIQDAKRNAIRQNCSLSELLLILRVHSYLYIYIFFERRWIAPKLNFILVILHLFFSLALHLSKSNPNTWFN